MNRSVPHAREFGGDRRIVESPEFFGNARAFAQKYAAFPQETIAANLARRIEEIAA